MPTHIHNELNDEEGRIFGIGYGGEGVAKVSQFAKREVPGISNLQVGLARNLFTVSA